MDKVTRRSLLKGGMASLGFLALGDTGLFAAPKGWEAKRKPNLVFGILSDTHLQSGWDGKTPHGGFPLRYVVNAMELFRESDIDAFMHLGDMAHRGKNVEAQYHRDIFDKAFPHGKGRGGKIVEKLLVVGNHEWYGDVVGGPGAWAPSIWKDKEERKKHVLCGDMPGHWERIWGEKYEESWHKEVCGYHFFGRHWTTDEMKFADFIKSKAEECSLKGTKPFFILSHRRHHFRFFHALRDFPNAIAFFGHWHMSNADWKTIFMDDFGFNFFPSIQVGACRMDGGNCLDGKERVIKGDAFVEENDRKAAWSEGPYPSRQAMVVSVYGDAIVFGRHEVGRGGKLGPDWVMPLGKFKPHSFSRAELKKSVSEPQFRRGAKLVVAETSKAKASLLITIPFADADPSSRVYAYDVVIIGDDPKKRLFKSVYFDGVNLGVGHEPNYGLTDVEIPKTELPEGRRLTIAVRPISSLGTKGKAIAVTYSTVTKTLKVKRR